MAGYPISELKKASESKGRDLFPIQQDGVTRQVELGILSNASKITASTSSGVITKEGSYVLQNNSAVINFTLNNAVGRAFSNNDYVDSASAAAGWIVKVINLSTRSHTVIAGSNSWTIAAGDVHEYYWTGSAWTFHNVVTESRLNNALANYGKVYKMNKGLQGLGWYRIAEVNCGVHGFNIKLNLSTTYTNNEPCGKEISISQGWVENGVTVVTSTDKVPLFQKIRISREGSGATRKAIIDVYYGSSAVNTVFVNITSLEENITLIDFTKITEEVSGTEFDIRTDLSALTTYKYGQDGLSPNDSLSQAVLTHFNSTGNYATFSGASQLGQEGYYRGYRHNGYGEGIIISRGSLYFFLIQNGAITIKKVMGLM